MDNSCSTPVLSRLAIFVVVCGIAVSPAQLYPQRTTGMLLTSTVSVTEQDPNKPASELNHHLAGYALIAIGALVIAGYSADRFRPLQLIWPFLFVAAGLFLAAWSDAEIWPRGNLSWRFLIHHDLEARQHKIYALLLILIGIIEYLRARSKLNRFWRSWAFPLLALAGAVSCFSTIMGRRQVLRPLRRVSTWFQRKSPHESKPPQTQCSVCITMRQSQILHRSTISRGYRPPRNMQAMRCAQLCK